MDQLRKVKTMKLIQAMKLVKDLAEKAEDLRRKVARYCVDLDYETPTYENQANQIAEWVQSHTSIIQEIASLRVSIQRTNILTPVTIELGGKQVTKTIAEWVHRRRELSQLDYAMWSGLTDRNLKEGTVVTSSGEKKEVHLRRYYKPAERDQKLELYRSEPSLIDSTLEIVNATTEVIS